MSVSTVDRGHFEFGIWLLRGKRALVCRWAEQQVSDKRFLSKSRLQASLMADATVVRHRHVPEHNDTMADEGEHAATVPFDEGDSKISPFELEEDHEMQQLTVGGEEVHSF